MEWFEMDGESNGVREWRVVDKVRVDLCMGD